MYKAKKIVVDPQNIYAEDKLSRKDNVDNLSQLLKNISSPIVMSINAPWGAGKTTFVQMLKAHLGNAGEHTVYFNAWETDFAQDALLAFLGEIGPEIEAIAGEDAFKQEVWRSSKLLATKFIKRGMPAALKIATAGIIDASEFTEDTLADLLGTVSGEMIEEYSKTKNAINEFKENIVKILESNEEPLKLYIFVDELDRCRPTYAIELLERIKHLFDIEGLVFLLAMDVEQLTHSINAVYGTNFNSSEYLRRFIDVEYQLPQAEMAGFVQQKLIEFGIADYCTRRDQIREFRGEFVFLLKAISSLAIRAQMSLRGIEQFIAHINIVLRTSEWNQFMMPPLLIFLVFMKKYHSNVYRTYTFSKDGLKEALRILDELMPDDSYGDAYMKNMIEGFIIAAKAPANGKEYQEVRGELLRDRERESLSDRERERIGNVLEVLDRPPWLSFAHDVQMDHLVSRINMLDSFKFSQEQK